MSWYEEKSEVPPLKLGHPPIYVTPPVARSLSITYDPLDQFKWQDVIHVTIRTVSGGHTYFSDISYTTIKQRRFRAIKKNKRL